MRHVSILLVFTIVVGLCAARASATTGFATEGQFRSFDPFAVDVYVQFLTDLMAPVGIGYTSYYSYNQAIFAEGGFPIRAAYASELRVPTLTSVNDQLGAVTADGFDRIIAPPYGLIGLLFPGGFNALGFFLTDTVPHNRNPYIYGEYITRGIQTSSGFVSLFSFDFQGVDDVFIGYINDVTGFQGLWAGWYRDKYGITDKDVRSADYIGSYNGVSHFLAPAAYVGAGGDPHMVTSPSQLSG